MDQPTPRKRRSPWVRYAPLIVIVVVIVVVVAVAALSSSSSSNKKTTNTVGTTPADQVPVQFQAAVQDNTVGNYTWQDHCDKTTGRVAMPVVLPAPCVPKFTGNNGGVTYPGVTATTIRIGYYLAKPDAQYDALLQLAGAYDPPAKVEQAVKDYVQIYSSQFETYGRKVQLVKIQGTGTSADETAAKNDADTAAKQDNVFAVIGGPPQAKNFSAELAANHVLCLGTCSIAQPQSYYAQHAPYIWPVGPSPDQADNMMLEYLKKQLVDKDAVYAGDPKFHTQKRTFAFLSYDTPDGQYSQSWSNFTLQLKDAGIPLKLHKSYFLDPSTIPQTAHEIAVALKQANATTVIFTGDPIMPRYFTQDSTQQGYFPEWVMAGTVFADTAIFARTFDQQQWQHAWGLELTPPRVPKEHNEAYTLHQWYFGTPPPSKASFAVTWGDVAQLFAGLQTAGPNLTPETFKQGMFNVAPQAAAASPNNIQTVVTYGDHGYWPNPPDPNGLDNAGIIWWNPNVSGQDETGTVGKGMYEMVNGGRRYLPGQWPTDPLPLFNTTGAVTIYNNPPPQITPRQYPAPAGSPQAAKGG
jgi:hypothetical protein